MKLFIGSLLITILFYAKILNGFFQQDEWLGFSRYLLRQGLDFIAPTVTHYAPLTQFALHLTLSAFGMNYIAHAITSILLHLVTISLLFILFKKVFKLELLAGIGVVIFASFSSIHQATSWVMADIGTHLATIFGILSIVKFMDFLKNKINKEFAFSIIFLIISLLFKEVTIGLFFVMIFLLWKSDFKATQKTKYIRKVVNLGIIYGLLRLAMIPFVNTVQGDAGLVFETQNLSKVVYDLILIPVKAFSQTIVPIEIVRNFSEVLARLLPINISHSIGSPEFEYFVVTKVMETISILLLLVFIWIVFKKYSTNITVLGLIWIIVNSLVFALSPQRSGITSVIDSRNLYFVSIGSSFILVSIFNQIKAKQEKTAYIFLAFIMLINIYYLNKNLNQLVKVGVNRKSILNQITNSVPKLPQKTVIYTQSNQSYYGLPEIEKIMPFQSGFGQTLLVWYYPAEVFPKDFFKDRFLWEIDSQGYKEIDGRGFGYFRDLDLLLRTIRQYNLPTESIIAFSWDGKKSMLRDITAETIEKIENGKN